MDEDTKEVNQSVWDVLDSDGNYITTLTVDSSGPKDVYTEAYDETRAQFWSKMNNEEKSNEE